MATLDERKHNVMAIQTKFASLFKNSSSDIESIQVNQWIPIAESLSVNELDSFNQYLLTRSYFVGQFVSLADIFVYNAIISLIKSDLSSLSKHVNLLRWLSNISYLVNDGLYKTISKQPTLILTSFFTSLSTPTSTSTTPSVPIMSADKSKGKSTDQKKSKEPNQPDTTVKPEGKKAKPTPTPTPIPTEETSEDLDPSKLDIRVGTVIRCWNHPESEKLLCEEIDIGEATVRLIASGLRGHYTAEEVQGRKVLVLANLKERPMAGFKSQVYYRLVLLYNIAKYI